MYRIWKKGLFIMTACLMMSVTACGKEEDKDSKTDENKTSQTEEKMETGF